MRNLARETHQVVTELIIDASGSLRGAAEHVRATKEAELATNKLSDAEEKARLARENGGRSFIGVSTSLAKVRAEYTNLASSLDPAMKMQLRHQREMEQAVLRTDAAVRRGIAAEADAIQLISRLRARQVQEINQVRDATQNLVRMQAAANTNNPSSFNSANIAAQMQDIVVTAQMGMSPLQIALQQGTQLSAVFNEMKGNGVSAGRAIGNAFLSIVNPMSLITLGAVAVSAAVLQWLTTSKKEAKELEGVLDRQGGIVRNLETAYGAAAVARAKYENAGGDQNIARAEIGRDRNDLTKQIQEQSRAINEQLTGSWRNFSTLVDRTKTFPTLAKDIEAFIAATARGEDGMGAFVSALDEARARGDITRGVAVQLEQTATQARSAADEFRPFQDEVATFMAQAAQGQGDLEQFNARILAIGKATGFDEQARKIVALMKPLGHLLGLLKQINDAMSLPEDARSHDADGSLAKFAGEERRRILDLRRAEKERTDARIAGISAVTDAEKIAAAVAAAGAGITNSTERRIREENAAREEAARLTAEHAEAAREEAKRTSEAARERALSREDAIRQAEEELSLIGVTVGEAARLRAEYEMIADARRDNKGIVTPEELARIREAAAAIGQINQQRAIKSAEEGILFDRSLIGLPDQEKRIRSSIKSIGLDFDSVDGQRLAGEMRYNDALRRTEAQMNDIREAGKSAFMDIVDAISQGENAIDAVIGALSQLGRKFAEIGMERLFDGLSGKGWGGFASSFSGAPRAAANQNNPIPVKVVADNFTTTTTHSYSAGYSGGSNLSSYLRKGQGQSHIEGLSADFADALSKMLQAAPEAVRSAVTINSGFRSVARQGQLFEAAVKKYGSEQAARRWVAPPGNSQHNRGMAADLGYTNSAAREWFHQNAGKYGLAFPLGHENWHIELASARGGTKPAAPAVSDVAVEALSKTNLKQGVEAGVIGANQKIGVDPTLNMTGGGTGAQGGFFQNGGMSVLGAGAGAFAQGFESGSPFGGGISGAMSGFGVAPQISSALGIGSMAGGILGVVGGGLLGVLGGIFGKKRREKQEREAAKKQLEQQMGAIEDMLDYAAGTVVGSITKSMRDYRDEVGKAIELATKAGDTELKEKLENSVDQLEKRLVRDFKDAFAGTIEGMNLGLGISNPFKQGFDAVKQLREELLAFVDDAKTAGLILEEAAGSLEGAAGDLAKAAKAIGDNPLTSWANNIQMPKGMANYHDLEDIAARHARGELVSQAKDIEAEKIISFGGGQGDSDRDARRDYLLQSLKDAKAAWKAAEEAAQAAADAAGEVIVKYNEAQRAAFATALATLSGPAELTAVEEAMMELRGKAAALPPVLEDLGMKAADAAAAIEDHLSRGIDKLRMDMIDDLNSSINDLAGYGWLNEIVDAQELYQDRLKDGAALGIDAARAQRELGLSLQQIATDANLTQAQLDMLAGVFPELAAAFASVVPGNELLNAQARVERAEADLRRAYEEEKSALEQTIDRHERFIESVKKFKSDLLLDSSLSPLGARDRLTEAQKQFQEVAAKALTGDEDAMGRLEEVSRDYLAEAKAYYASSEQYFSIFNEVQALLDKSLTASKGHLSEAQQQLATLKDQVGKLIDIDESVMSVADAIANLQAAQMASDAALRTHITQMAIDMAYANALGRSADQPGVDYWRGQIDAGKDTIGGVVDKITNSNEAKIQGFYRDILGRQGSTAEIRYWLDSGKSLQQIHDDIAWAKKQGSYALGGYTGDIGRNQIAGVVHGQEFVMPAERTRQYMPDLQAMYAGRFNAGNDNSAATNRALLAQVERLTAEVERLTSIVHAGAQANVDATNGTTAAVKGKQAQARIAGETRMVA